MEELEKNDRPLWWFTGAFFLLLMTASWGFYLYDQQLSNEALETRVQKELVDDLRSCAQQYEQAENPNSVASSCAACVLGYDATGKLVSWSGDELLPPKEYIDRLSKIHGDEDLLQASRRVYLQLLQKRRDTTWVVLLPVYIQYKVNNNFLIPYVFLGRYQGFFTDEDRRNIRPFDRVEGNVRLTSPNNNAYLLTLRGLPLERLRYRIRLAVLIVFAIGLIGFLVSLRMISLSWGKGRLQSNLVFLILLPMVRLLLLWADIPGQYLDLPLFSPNVLAYDWRAPNLGDFTLNAITVFLLIWVIYDSAFTRLLPMYRDLMRFRWARWLIPLANLIICSVLLWAYMNFFRALIDSSLVVVDFTNIFETNLYSYLILFNIGLLFVAILLLMGLFLRLNALWFERTGQPGRYVLAHLVVLVVVNSWLHELQLMPLLLSVATIAILMFSHSRNPSVNLYRFSLLSHIFLIIVGSAVAALIIVNGKEERDRATVQRIANQVLQDRREKAVLGFQRSTIQLNHPDARGRIEAEYRNQQQLSAFVEWVGNTYLKDNFEAFETQLFAFDVNKNRVDDNQRAPLGEMLDTARNDFGLSEIGTSLETNSLFQIPSQSDRYLDAFVARYPLEVDSQRYTLLLALSANPYAMGSISPIVLVNSLTYEDEKFFSEYDYAIYVDGRLRAEHSQTAFPLELEPDLITSQPLYLEQGDYIVYAQSIAGVRNRNRRTVVVRYTKPTGWELFTMFSFIFYFFGISFVLLGVVPGFARRLAAANYDFNSLPIRSRIRVAIIGVSAFPIVAIILITYPYLNQRFNQEAEQEIVEEVKRISRQLEQPLIQYHRSGSNAYRESLRNTMELLSRTQPYDINIYDEAGRLLGSTQPALFETQISSGLMNYDALQTMRDELSSNRVFAEKIGDLDYLAGYQPILDEGRHLLGYVNLPFHSKTEELNEQVYGLVANMANIYLLTFLLVGIIAVLITRAITQPLALIQSRLANIRLGSKNEPIAYQSTDEIGAIVEAYNEMVEKLGDSEERLARTQRQLAWRQMARQVAHEIKNPLTPMRLSIQHLSRSYSGDEEKFARNFPRVMKKLLTQIDSLVHIANSFSQFAKMPEPEKAKLNLTELVREVVDLYREHEGIHWVEEITRETLTIDADPDQLRRAVGNVIKNAIQAMEERGEIRVRLTTKSDTARIEIRDTGPGIPEEVRARVFEPNFSTKNSGMGLGLAMVRRIVESFEGTIRFETTEGVGTTFFIELPVVAKRTPVPSPVQSI